MKSLHLFMSVLVFSFVASMSIMTDDENPASPVHDCRVTPLSPKKSKNDKAATQVQHPVTPLQDLDETTSGENKTDENGGMVRTESFDRLAQSVRGFPSSHSLGSLFDLYATLAATPVSPKRKALENLPANLFPANPTSHHGITPIK